MTPTFHPLYEVRLPLLEGLAGPGMAPDPVADAARRAFDAPFSAPRLPDVEITALEVPGPNGVVPVRAYRSRNHGSEPVPALVWMHGGAFLHGDLDVPEADHFARQMAARTDAVVFSVDYRLCTDTVKMPVPHDDCYAVYTWVRHHTADWGVDPARIAVGGGSAGGNLAASVALHGGETGQTPWQMLLAYPVVHPEHPAPSAELSEALALTPPALRFTAESSRVINEYVLGRPISGASAYDFPGLAADAGTFPPAYIENSEFDDLRASGEAFAEQLAAAGIDVELVTARGVPHGHLNAVGSPMLEESYERFATRLRKGPRHD